MFNGRALVCSPRTVKIVLCFVVAAMRMDGVNTIQANANAVGERVPATHADHRARWREGASHTGYFAWFRFDVPISQNDCLDELIILILYWPIHKKK